MLIKFSEWVAKKESSYFESKKKPSGRKKNYINTSIDAFVKAVEELEKDLESLEKAKASSKAKASLKLKAKAIKDKTEEKEAAKKKEDEKDLDDEGAEDGEESKEG
jgi:hypothetical protein